MTIIYSYIRSWRWLQGSIRWRWRRRLDTWKL